MVLYLATLKKKNSNKQTVYNTGKWLQNRKFSLQIPNTSYTTTFFFSPFQRGINKFLLTYYALVKMLSKGNIVVFPKP